MLTLYRPYPHTFAGPNGPKWKIIVILYVPSDTHAPHTLTTVAMVFSMMRKPTEANAAYENDAGRRRCCGCRPSNYIFSIMRNAAAISHLNVKRVYVQRFAMARTEAETWKSRGEREWEERRHGRQIAVEWRSGMRCFCVYRRKRVGACWHWHECQDPGDMPAATSLLVSYIAHRRWLFIMQLFIVFLSAYCVPWLFTWAAAAAAAAVAQLLHARESNAARGKTLWHNDYCRMIMMLWMRYEEWRRARESGKCYGKTKLRQIDSIHYTVA